MLFPSHLTVWRTIRQRKALSCSTKSVTYSNFPNEMTWIRRVFVNNDWRIALRIRPNANYSLALARFTAPGRISPSPKPNTPQKLPRKPPRTRQNPTNQPAHSATNKMATSFNDYWAIHTYVTAYPAQTTPNSTKKPSNYTTQHRYPFNTYNSTIVHRICANNT